MWGRLYFKLCRSLLKLVLNALSFLQDPVFQLVVLNVVTGCLCFLKQYFCQDKFNKRFFKN